MTGRRGMAACVLVLVAVALATGSGCCTILAEESVGRPWRAQARWKLRSCALERNVDDSLTLYLRIDRDGQLWDLTEHVVERPQFPSVPGSFVLDLRPVTTATPVRLGQPFPPRSPLDGRSPVSVVLRALGSSYDEWTWRAGDPIRHVRADGVIESRTDAVTADEIATSWLLAYNVAEGWAALVAPRGSPPLMFDQFSLTTGEPPARDMPAEYWIALPFLVAIDTVMLPLEIPGLWLLNKVSGKTLSELLDGD